VDFPHWLTSYRTSLLRLGSGSPPYTLSAGILNLMESLRGFKY